MTLNPYPISHPDPLATFGVRVFTSRQCGFEALRTVLVNRA